MHAVGNSEKSLYCSLDKENFLNEITKVSHVSYHVLNSNFNLLVSDNLTDRQKEDSADQQSKDPESEINCRYLLLS